VSRLVLVGGGHAHLHVLADLAARPLAALDVTLVSPSRWHHSSGMVPGFLQGTYAEADLAIDLPELAGRAGARVVQAVARRVDADARVVETEQGALPFDVLSLDVGADPGGLSVPGVADHAMTIRPLRQAIEVRERVDALSASGRRGPVRLTVVGAGAGGVEVALALHRRVRDAGPRPEVTLVEAATDVLPDYEVPARRRAAGILTRRGIAVVLGSAVDRVEADGVTLAGGRRIATDLVVWLVGAAGPRLLADGRLPLDGRGFLLVDASLRSVSGAPIWGAGDCVTLADHPRTPKAGVYAVRQGPVLSKNLRAALGHGRPARYVPQRTFLSLLNTADGKALLRWHGLVSHSRVAWRLKDFIDRRFVGRYRSRA
jgi:pyridine nucleotide-disulfide oxidoreductase family protein